MRVKLYLKVINYGGPLVSLNSDIIMMVNITSWQYLHRLKFRFPNLMKMRLKLMLLDQSVVLLNKHYYQWYRIALIEILKLLQILLTSILVALLKEKASMP